MANGECPLHGNLEAQLRQVVTEVREGNREARAEFAALRKEQRHNTDKINRIDVAVAKMEGKDAGRMEVTGEVAVKSNVLSNKARVVIGIIAVLVSVSALVVSIVVR